MVMYKDYVGIHSTDFCNTLTGELLMLSYLGLYALCVHINEVKCDHCGCSDVRLQLCSVCHLNQVLRNVLVPIRLPQSTTVCDLQAILPYILLNGPQILAQSQ
jgi:hypothetical protein